MDIENDNAPAVEITPPADVMIYSGRLPLGNMCMASVKLPDDAVITGSPSGALMLCRGNDIVLRMSDEHAIGVETGIVWTGEANIAGPNYRLALRVRSTEGIEIGAQFGWGFK